MTGEAPVSEARELSVSFGSVRTLGDVGFDVGRGVAGDVFHGVIVLDFGRKIADGLPQDMTNRPGIKKAYLVGDDGEPGAAGAAAEVGMKVA